MRDGPRRFPQDFSCPAVLRYPLRVRLVFAYVAITLSGRSFQTASANQRIGNSTVAGPTTPETVTSDKWKVTRKNSRHSALITCHCLGFGLFRFRSPLLSESLLFSLPPGTEMVHFPGFASSAYVFSGGFFGISQRGFPHSEIPGSKLICSSPGLIAAYRVLHRLQVPRHSPYTLSSLTIRNSNLRSPWPVARGHQPQHA